MHYDLIIHRTRLHRMQATVDIAVKDGLFARIAPELSDAQVAREIDAKGCLVLPPFVDAHVHLDAVLTVGAAALQCLGHAA